VDLDIEIPPMILQPYVENAIVHGLENREGKGRLSIKIENSYPFVIIQIEDDGLGREASAQLQREDVKRHRSVSTRVTEERLRLMSSHENISVQVVDKMKDGMAEGTMVVISIQNEPYSIGEQKVQ